MIPASTIAKLATLGLSAEQATAVAEMMAEVEAATEGKAGAAIEARRASDRERKAKQRHVMSRDVTGRPVKGRDGADPAPPPSLPPGPPNPPTPTPEVIPLSPPSEAPEPQPKPSRGATLPDGWQPNPRHFEIAAEYGLGAAWVAGKAEVMRDWAKANRNRAVGRKADWDATFNGFLRRDGPKERGREILLKNPPGGRQPRADHVADAFDEILEFAREHAPH